MQTDSIADCFTRLRNGAKARLENVELPYSKLNESILNVLRTQGFILDVEQVDVGARKKNLRARLKYNRTGEATLEHIRRISKPGHRIYTKIPEAGKIRGGLGFQILTTSKGVMTDRQAQEAKIGGELIGEVY